jgi:hypothetical protein
MDDLIHDRQGASRIPGSKMFGRCVAGIAALFRTINGYLLPTPSSSIPSDDDYRPYGRWVRKDLGWQDDADWSGMP